MLLFASTPALIESATFALECPTIDPALKNELISFLREVEGSGVLFILIIDFEMIFRENDRKVNCSQFSI